MNLKQVYQPKSGKFLSIDLEFLQQKGPRLNKAIKLVENDKVQLLSQDIAIVQGSNGDLYTVDLKNSKCVLSDLQCSPCPDHFYNLDQSADCKHIMAAKITLELAQKAIRHIPPKVV